MPRLIPFFIGHAVATLILSSALSASAQTVVVDNTDPGFAVLSEAWGTSTGTGQYGTDYRYRSTSQAPGLVEWRPDLPAAADYQVAVWYRSTNDRPQDACYVVEHLGGSTPIYVDQRLNGGQWVPIGTYEFAAGATGRVTLTSAAEPGKTIVADAVRFAAVSSGEEIPELRSCWLTHYYYLGKSESQLRALAQNIKAGHMNTVYIAMYSGATVYWPSQAYKTAGGNWGSSSVDYAAYLTDIFHSEGLKVGAWFEYGLAVGAATHPLAVAHPEWLARDRYGDPVTGENGGFVFLSPGCEDAMAMIEQMARELAENYNFDDIQLDRFRWGRKDTGREYGYEDCTSDRYYAQYGTYPPTNVNNSQWVAFREGLVNAAVERCYDAIKAANPNILVSSAPLGSYGITQMMQRWSAWVNGGYMDLVMPQMYMTTLSSFITELNTQLAQAPAHLDKLGVGYRASDDNDWTLVADQLEYAFSRGITPACLWVYHQYTSQVAIQDEIDNLPLPGQPWASFAYNPFTSERLLQVVVDNRDAAPRYQETGTWTTSAQPDFFRFDSRVAAGGTAYTASWQANLPKSGRFDVYAWYTAASNRNDQAPYTVAHYNGTTTVNVDQRTTGGQWVKLGRWVFEAGPLTQRVSVSTTGSAAAEYTSADAVKLVLTGYALGDADGDDDVDAADFTAAAACVTGPDGGPVGSSCEAFDFNDDGDVDLADLTALQRAFSGS